jgi:glutathione synthase/RimK-type ligase-like ATP-grasp enzyme
LLDLEGAAGHAGAMSCSRKRVALATCRERPELDEDGPALIEAFGEAGCEARSAVWDDPGVDWAGFEAVLLRCTWDYAPRRREFLCWAREVERRGRLLNRAAVVEWNTDKHYLAELGAAGAPVVETLYLEPGEALGELRGERVIKPAVSAGSRDTGRFTAAEQEEAARLVARLHGQGRAVMVQPYLGSVDDEGETALVFIGGSFSHAIRKGPLLRPGGEMTDQLFASEEISERRVSEEEIEAARLVLAAMPFEAESLAYARVDLVRDAAGRPTLLELELTEPSLFLQFEARAAGKLVAATLDRLAPARA